MPTRATLSTHTTPTNGKRTRPQARKAKSKKNGTNGKANGRANGANGNGHKALVKAELEVLCAELTQQNVKLIQTVTELQEQVDAIHRYLDALHVPKTADKEDLDAEPYTLPKRVVAGAKLWFAKRGGIESSDHVSSTLRKMLRAAGEWRCLNPGAYPEEALRL